MTRSADALAGQGLPAVELYNPRQHDVSQFTSGEPQLDRYIKERALSDRRRRGAAIYVLAEPTDPGMTPVPRRVIGYYTINSLSFPRDTIRKADQRRVPQYGQVSAVLIGRLAVDQSFQGRGLGAALLAEALETVDILSVRLGISAVVVHALHEIAARFYLHHGFQRFADLPLHLYYLLGTYEEALAQQDEQGTS